MLRQQPSSITNWVSLNFETTGRRVEGLLAETYVAPAGRKSQVEAHSHAGWQFTLSPDCDGIYNVAGSSHQVPRGSVSIIPSGETHGCGDPTDRAGAMTWRVVTIEDQMFTRAADAAPDHATAIGVFVDTDFVNEIERLHRSVWRGGCPLEVMGQLECVGAMLATLLTGAAVVERHTPRKALDHVRQQLEDSPHAPTLAELSDTAGLSRFHMLRCFREEYGMTPHRYYRHRRAERAKWMLGRGDDLIDVALSCGFADQSHMTREFRHFYGVTPSAYAKR